MLRFVGAVSLALALPVSVLGQFPLSEEKLQDKLISVEEKVAEIRTKCFAVIVEERTSDDPDQIAPLTVRLEHIYANDDERGLRRHDVCLCGSVYKLPLESSWVWIRSQERKGKPKLRIGSPKGEPYESSRPNFVPTVDPLALTTSAYVGVAAGKADERWYSQVFLNAKIIDGFRDRRGDVTVNLVTSKDRTRGCQIKLAKKFDYLPTSCKFTMNKFKKPGALYKHGEVYSSVTTEWEKTKDGKCLPSRVVVSVDPYDGYPTSNHCDFRIQWLPLEKFEGLLFEEEQMRNRWDTVESLVGYQNEKGQKYK